MELVGRDLHLEAVLNSMYRIGRAYPTQSCAIARSSTSETHLTAPKQEKGRASLHALEHLVLLE